MLHTSTPHEQATRLSPVVATCILVNLGRSAELTHHNHKSVLVGATFMHVADEGRDALIKLGELFVEPFKDFTVMIPAGVIDGYEANPRFD